MPFQETQLSRIFFKFKTLKLVNFFPTGEIYHFFVDFNAAFDSTVRKSFYAVSSEFGIPAKLTRMVNRLMRTSEAKSQLKRLSLCGSVPKDVTDRRLFIV